MSDFGPEHWDRETAIAFYEAAQRSLKEAIAALAIAHERLEAATEFSLPGPGEIDILATNHGYAVYEGLVVHTLYPTLDAAWAAAEELTNQDKETE